MFQNFIMHVCFLNQNSIENSVMHLFILGIRRDQMMKKANMKRRSFVKPLKVSHSRFVERRSGDSVQQFVASSCEDILEEVLII